jgi:hypothetical protein
MFGAVAGITVAVAIVLGLLFVLKTSERCQSDRVKGLSERRSRSGSNPKAIVSRAGATPS